MELKQLQKLAKEKKLVGVFDVPDEIYHHPDCPGLSNSKLKAFTKAKDSFLWASQFDSVEENTREALNFGSAFHCRVLEPEHFATRFVEMPTWNLRTKDGKAQRDEFIKQSLGKKTITADEANRIIHMSASIMFHKKANGLLTNGKKEQAFFWMHDGIQMKGKADIVIDKQRVFLADVKTQKFLKDFGESAYSFGYDRQAALYMDGWKKATGQEVEKFFFIICEKLRPHSTIVRTVPDKALKGAHHLNNEALHHFKKCQEDPKRFYDVEDYELCFNQKKKLIELGIM